MAEMESPIPSFPHFVVVSPAQRAQPSLKILPASGRLGGQQGESSKLKQERMSFSLFGLRPREFVETLSANPLADGVDEAETRPPTHR